MLRRCLRYGGINWKRTRRLFSGESRRIWKRRCKKQMSRFVRGRLTPLLEIACPTSRMPFFLQSGPKRFAGWNLTLRHEYLESQLLLSVRLIEPRLLAGCTCSLWMHRAKRCRIPGERAGQRWEPAQRRLHSRSLQVLSVADLNEPGADVCFELWISLASLLRSYTALHGLNGNQQATVELSDERIVVSHGSKQLHLERMGASIIWKREDGSRGTLKLTETGQLRSNSDEEEMDLAAEAWARELMQ